MTKLRHSEGAARRISNDSHFEKFGLSLELLNAIKAIGWKIPTPIQEKVIPQALKGRDVLGRAQTGTGKTGAFVLPMVERLNPQKPCAALVLCPTREIALQTEEAFCHFGGPKQLTAISIIGGASMQKQKHQLKKNPHIIVATPGRLIDHLEQRTLSLKGLNILVLDEADRMLDMGFMPQIREILKRLPPKHQTMLFSATLPPSIEQLIAKHLHDPVKIDIAPDATVAQGAEQALYFVDQDHKKATLLALLIAVEGPTLIFTRTKIGANTLFHFLEREGIAAVCMHSDFHQRDRIKALREFKEGKYRVLVATDIVSRGIDIEGIAHVINYTVPQSPDDYVHRIGRTARASKTGHASTIATLEEKLELNAIERLIGAQIPRKSLEGIEHVNEAPTVLQGRGRRTIGRRRGALKSKW